MTNTVTIDVQDFLSLVNKERALDELLKDTEIIISIYNYEKKTRYYFRKSKKIIEEMDKEINQLKKLNYEATQTIINQGKYIEKIRKNKFLNFFTNKIK